jgi:hypothetical protein
MSKPFVRRAVLLALFVTVPLPVMVGCTPEAPRPKRPTPTAPDPTLEEARAALVAMVKGSQDNLMGLALESLRTSPPVEKADGWIAIGDWKIHLAEQTFYLMSKDGKADRRGALLWDADRKWHAVITASRAM